MGPQHPSTHGVLRLIVELDGEQVVRVVPDVGYLCLLYTSDAADERSSVDLGGRRIIKKKTHQVTSSDVAEKT